MTEPQPKLTRQQIWQRIRETSKDEYILEEMMRLGFWPKDSDKPTLTEDLIKRRSELSKKLRELGRQQALYQDPEKALQELHKQRKKEALERREEVRRKNNQERFEKHQRWYDIQQQTITWLGEGSFKPLQKLDTNNERLQQLSLPIIKNAQQLAANMGITLNELRFLSYYREVTTQDHYQHFAISKKSGGQRFISAPMPRLKRAQYWILDNILERPDKTANAHGFIKERSIVTNAAPHVDKAVVINMDIQDFFPTITFKRVKGLFHKYGYSEQVAYILASICTAPVREHVELDGKRWFVATTERALPQGAPTSPALSNLVCRKLDLRLQGMADSLGYGYTRYADDMTFSSAETNTGDYKKLVWRCRQIVKDEGFILHPDKTRVMHAGTRQEVTGIVVNKQLSVNRKTLKKFRALLHHIDKDGFEGKQWGHGALLPSIEGFANYVVMVNPSKGILLQQKVASLKLKYGITIKPEKLRELNNKRLRLLAAEGKAPREQWWQAQPPQAPELEKTTAEVQQERKEARKSKQDKRQQEPVQQKTESTSTQQQIPRRDSQRPPEVEIQPGSEWNETPGSQTGKVMIYIAVAIVLLLLIRLL